MNETETWLHLARPSPWLMTPLNRVRSTPQPDCFRVVLHMFSLLYLLLLPLLSYDILGYLVIPEGTLFAVDVAVAVGFVSSRYEICTSLGGMGVWRHFWAPNTAERVVLAPSWSACSS